MPTRIDDDTLEELATDRHDGETVLEGLLAFRNDMYDEQSADELVAETLGTESEHQ